jgi:hypothetical protein
VECKAEVVVSFGAWAEAKVAPTTHEVIVLAPEEGLKREPVTGRLLKTLPHPDRKAYVGNVQFSKDGARLLTAGYQFQFWDTATWKEAGRIGSLSGLHGDLSDATVTPDWKTVLVGSRTRRRVREEKGGKVVERLQVDGRIDRYDVATGKLRDSIPLAGRGPFDLRVTPDGKYALVNVEGSIPDIETTRRQSFLELVDLRTKATRRLLDTSANPAFAADGKTAFFSTVRSLLKGTELRVNASLVKYDLAGRNVLKRAGSPDDQTFFDHVFLSPDGKWLATGQRRIKPYSVTLVILSADTLEEVARIPGPKEQAVGTYFDSALFTLDSRRLITRCKGPVLVWDRAAKSIARSVPVGELASYQQVTNLLPRLVP